MTTKVKNIPKPKYHSQVWITKEFNRRAFLWPDTTLRAAYGLNTTQCVYMLYNRPFCVKYQVAEEFNKPVEFILN